MTEKLFYEDSHMVTFSATVVSCEQSGEVYEVVLDRTAFFPEGGGQYADTGRLDDAKVTDVQEKAGIIYHKTNQSLEIGKTVQGTIDWEERFSKMQQHSGEHIVSGIVHAVYGYDNVGFHMGKDAITMDFNGSISKEELKVIERKANEAVVKNLDIKVLYPAKEELETVAYRSKIEIEGQVRIVEIPGYDVCACCAPHVKKTGEIGLIKLLNVQNYKGGVRISMLCGFRALQDYEQKAESVKNISVLLSAPEEEVFSEVTRLKQEISSGKAKVSQLQQKLLVYKVEQIPQSQKVVVWFEEELEGNAPRELTNLIIENGALIGAVFAGDEKDGYRYVIGSGTVQQRSPGQRIWRLIGPIIVKMAVAFVVEAVVILLYAIFVHPETFQAVSSQEELMQKTVELTDGVLKYATQISALAALCTIPILAWMFRKDRKLEKENGVTPQKKAAFGKYILIVGISIPVALGGNNLLLLSNLSEVSEGYKQASEMLYTPSLPVQIICLGIVIPIMEELIFRGLLFKRLREVMPMVPAVIYSALFFGLYHGNLVQIIYGTICGLLLAYVYEKFGSLKAPVLMHMTMNILACVVTELNGFAWMLDQPMRMGIITVLCALVASGMFVLIKDM